MKATFIAQISVGNVLGEGALWDNTRRCAWWTDIQERKLHRYFPESRQIDVFDLPERLGSFGLIERSHRLIAAFESGFAYWDPEAGTIEWIARPSHEARNIRLNDGRVDRQGRFWAGSMVEGPGKPLGKLYCLSQGQIHVRRTDISISNSVCFSPDGHHMYFADTPLRAILRFDLDSATGALSNQQVFARTPPGAFPDGSAVDAEGFLWNAQWGASRIMRYAPDGSVSDELPVPVTQPSCVAFGGDNLDLLFVTSARESLEPDELANQPLAGNLLIYQTDVQGCEEPRYIEIGT